MDPSDLLARERKEIADTLKTLPGQQGPMADVLRALAHRLHALTAVEQNYLLVEARRLRIASAREPTFQATEQLLAELRDALPGSRRFEAIVRGLSLLNERRMHELSALRPALLEALGEEGLRTLGDEMARTLAPLGSPSPLGAG